MARFREWQEGHYAKLFKKLDSAVTRSWPVVSLPHVSIDGRHYWSAKRRVVILAREGNYDGPFSEGGWQRSLLAKPAYRDELFPALRAYWQETIDRRVSGGRRDKDQADWHARDCTEGQLFWQVMWDYAGALNPKGSRRRFDELAWTNLYRVSAAWLDKESFDASREKVRALSSAKRIPDTIVAELNELEPDIVVDCTQAHEIVDRLLDAVDDDREVLASREARGGRLQCERLAFDTGTVTWLRVPHFSYGTRPQQKLFVDFARKMTS